MNASLQARKQKTITKPKTVIDLGEYFLNLRTKCMGPKTNFNNDLSDIICDKDLVVENEILKLKLEEADQEYTFLRNEVEDLTVLLSVKIQTSSHNFKTNSKECLLQENFDTQVQS